MAFVCPRLNQVLVILQLPFVDSRAFLHKTSRLRVPTWPSPTGDEFLRSAGRISVRNKGGLRGWIGEARICDARRALRFRSLPSVALGKEQRQVRLMPRFRHFYADGLALAKLEIGFVPRRGRAHSLTRQMIADLISSLLSTTVEIPVPSEPSFTGTLRQAGHGFARQYARASSSLAYPPISPQDWWVKPGRPLIYLEFEAKHREAQAGSKLRTFDFPEFGFHLSHRWLEGGNFRVWTLVRGRGHDTNTARQFRICLLRLHAEQQAFSHILSHLARNRIGPEPGSNEGESLQRFLNNTTRRTIKEVSRGLKYGGAAESVINIARSLERDLSPGYSDSLIQKLETQIRLRPTVLGKVKDQLLCMTESAPLDFTKDIPGTEGAVFISCSHRDTEWMKRLVVILRPLVRRGAISVWTAKDILPGADWRSEVGMAIERARVAILLVSPDFLASDFIAENELPRLLRERVARKLSVIWVAVRPSLFSHTEVSAYQAANDPQRPLSRLSHAEQEEVLVDVCEQVLKALGAGRRPGPAE